MAAISAGEFERIFKEFYKPLCLFALRFTEKTEDAEDVVQQVFADVWDKNSHDMVIANFKSYLYQAVRNRSLTLIAQSSDMCIGNLRSGTENLHHYLHTKERKFLDSSLLYYGIIICFIIGAVIGNAVVRILHEKAILGCSFLLFVAFLIMFIDREKELRENSVS